MLAVLVELEAGMELMPIQKPMAVDQIHAGLWRSSASIGSVLELLLP